MIDKKSSEWHRAPIWVKLGALTISTRKTAMNYEIFSAIVGAISLLISLVNPIFIIGTAFLASAYWYAITVRWVDNNKLWDQKSAL